MALGTVVFWREKVSGDGTGDDVAVGCSVLFVIGVLSVYWCGTLTEWLRIIPEYSENGFNLGQ